MPWLIASKENTGLSTYNKLGIVCSVNICVYNNHHFLIEIIYRENVYTKGMT